MKSVTLGTIVSVLLLSVGVASPSIAQETAGTLYYYDSGWQSDNNLTSHDTVFQHSLGIPPSSLTIWFTPALVEGEAEEVYTATYSWHSAYSGNPVSIIVNSEEIKLSIWSGSPLHGFWTPTGGWRRYSTGYWRVIARP